MIRLYDAHVVRTYCLMTGDANAKFWKMSKEEKRQACISSLQSYSFQVVDDDKTVPEPPKINRRATIQEINKYYDTSIPNSVKYHSVAAVVRNLILAVNAHLCRLTPEFKSFLTEGDAPGTYLALERDRGPYYMIQGLLEPVPEVTISRLPDKYVIDNNFIQKMRKSYTAEAGQFEFYQICSKIFDLIPIISRIFQFIS